MRQITIVSPNTPGVMADITGVLADAGINIESVDAHTFNESAVIILTVDRYDEALRTLSSLPAIKAMTEDAILVRLKNRPGALAQISRRFKDANINIRSIRFLERDDEYGLVAISTERTREAVELVSDLLVGQ